MGAEQDINKDDAGFDDQPTFLLLYCDDKINDVDEDGLLQDYDLPATDRH